MALETRRFAGQAAIVTGAAGGIGRAIVERLATEGANVMAADRNPNVAKVAGEIASRHQASVMPFVADLGQKAAAQLLIDDTRKALGRIDVLVNNAGGGGVAPFDELDEEKVLATINNNYWTAFRCIQAALPIMRAQRYGRIVNVTANAVFGGLTNHAVVNSAKAGVHGLTSGLAAELGPSGITINTVAPAITAIESVAAQMQMKEPPPVFLKAVGRIPMGRPARVEEIAAAVVFFASGEASFISGQVLRVNGGSG